MDVNRASQWGLILAIWLGGILPGRAAAPEWVERLTIWATPELRGIEAEMSGIAAQLAGLPTPAGTSSGIRRGFQTSGRREGEDPWVSLTLEEPSEVDYVVLVPLVAKGARGQVPGYGFPRRFQLEATDEDGEVHLLLDQTSEDFENPGRYPVLAAGPPGVRIGEVRLTATGTWEQGDPRVLALSELLVLQGNRNIAMKGTVRSSRSRELTPAWSRANLIDMVTPLGLPVAPADDHRLGWHSEVATNKDSVKSVTVDLGQIHAVEELRLAPVWRRGVPVWYNYGFPSRYLVETATRADFSDRSVAVDLTSKSLQPPGQNFQCFLSEDRKPVRYLRVTATRLRERTGDYVFALGEVQAYVGNENVALGAEVRAEESVEDAEWGRAGLTDGLAGAGRLMELPEWFAGLERRRVLEQEEARLVARRGELIARGESVLITGSIGATAGIAALATLLTWRNRRQRRIDRERHRERLARDLHDELGSNLGSIALISSFARDEHTDTGQMRADLETIEEVARESAESMRDMVELLGGGHAGAESDWLAVLEGLAKRLLRGVDLDCRLPDGPLVVEPDLETRRELYLFCKEVLHNIARHAGAKSVRFLMRPRPDGLFIEIADDGCGFEVAAVSHGHGLGNLRERAAGLHAEFHLDATPGKGTVVTLDVPRGRRWRKPATRTAG